MPETGTVVPFSLIIASTESLQLPLMCTYLGRVIKYFEVIELLEYQMIFAGAHERESSLKGGFIAGCRSLSWLVIAGCRLQANADYVLS